MQYVALRKVKNSPHYRIFVEDDGILQFLDVDTKPDPFDAFGYWKLLSTQFKALALDDACLRVESVDRHHDGWLVQIETPDGSWYTTFLKGAIVLDEEVEMAWFRDRTKFTLIVEKVGDKTMKKAKDFRRGQRVNHRSHGSGTVFSFSHYDDNEIFVEFDIEPEGWDKVLCVSTNLLTPLNEEDRSLT